MEYTLKYGSHRTRGEGMCLLEAVAFLADEPHSDAPECACPVLSAYGRNLNDVMGKGPQGDALRTKYLADIALMLVGTRSTREVERRRAYLLADRAVRVFAPLALDAVGLHYHAAKLRALTPVTDATTTRAARAACDATWAACCDPAGDAAARAAANAAARVAARVAAGAACDAAGAAARVAACAAAAAVWTAARDAFIDAISLDTDNAGGM